LENIYLTHLPFYLLTGCQDGHICIWDVEGENMEAMPRCFLIGHSGPISALAYVHLPGEKFDLIVSASENG
jgi:WD40 repeat protein